MQRVGYIGLAKINLPGGTMRLAEGTVIDWAGERYLPSDPTYGAIASIEALSEGVGVEVPAMAITLLVPSTTAAATLVQPGFQKSRARFWMAQWDADTNTVTGTPALLFDGFLDQSQLTLGQDSFSLSFAVVAQNEQLFELNIGNSMNPTFHKTIWPGETGEDQATGLIFQDAWGVEAPVAAVAYAGVGGGGISLEDRSYVDYQ